MNNRRSNKSRSRKVFAVVALFTYGAFSGIRTAATSPAPQSNPKFRVIALAETNSIHRPFVDAAKIWLTKESAADNFAIDYITNTEKIDDAFLANYQLFLQLDYPPYGWTPIASAAFIKYIEQGEGGWIGFHHATLLGEFDGYPLWDWFSQFMGGIRFKNYIATFASAKVNVEDRVHPVMKGLGPSFEIEREEWYTYDRSPRTNVHVLATVDESSYTPDSTLKMGGDHPVVWTNEHVKARNVYIFMGHRAEHFQNPSFTTLFHNAILWAANQ
jgi:type 1 glutamine amidotransferase